MSEGTEAQVLAANRAFYAAFHRRDARAMAALWAVRAPVACIHPGWPPLTDREMVLKSWADILRNPASPKIQPRGEQALILGPSTAMVVLVEVIDDQALAATNVFVREDGDWRLVHHQASPLAGTLEAGGPEIEADDGEDTPPSTLLH